MLIHVASHGVSTDRNAYRMPLALQPYHARVTQPPPICFSVFHFLGQYGLLQTTCSEAAALDIIGV
jgi:hypothetical protein